jgi:hypothetical protein
MTMPFHSKSALVRVLPVLPVLIVVATATGACRRKEPATPPVAKASVAVNRQAAPLGSPLDLTYKFIVANDAKFDEDYRVMLHVVDADDELIWSDVKFVV